jgi:predicted Zn-dependent peptidase
VTEHPVFPEAELDRERAMALARLVQVRDEPAALAAMATAATLYGGEHPYGRPQFGTPASYGSITRGDLEQFYRGHLRPDQAVLIAVGDVTPADLLPRLEKAFADWKRPAVAPVEARFPAAPQAQPTRVVLVDKPGAAQSVISVSLIGTDRRSPDYFALTVMNSVFGGQFSSRLNLNLREQKGYTYGARTSFDWRVRQPGPLVASASVQTAVTAPALTEFLAEFHGMAGGRPVTAEEVAFSKDYLVRGYAAGFETCAQVASQLETLVEFHLPDDYFNTYIPKTTAVTPDEVLSAARKYLPVGNLSIIVVGDRSKIEAALRALPVGKDLTVYQFDADFRLAPAR